MENKISKLQFIRQIRNKKGCSAREASEIYDIFMSILTEEILKGNSVSLLNFGVFSLKIHKGHPVQFAETRSLKDDYLTLKFSPSNTFVNKLRNSDSKLIDYIKQKEG